MKMKMTVFLLAMALVAINVAPPALAISVTCSGGATVDVLAASPGVDAAGVNTRFVRLNGQTPEVWENTNGQGGLQITDRVCVVKNDQGTVIQTYKEFEMDTRAL